jgi:hypothetical protein
MSLVHALGREGWRPKALVVELVWEANTGAGA